MNKKYDFIVLGAGLAGLSFAKRISENGHSVLLLEKENTVGGISRTIQHNGFYLDFCAHRFHTNNKALLNEILDLNGFSMKKHMKKSRIYMFDKYLKYPFQLQNLLRAMPFTKCIMCSFSFVVNLIKKNFQDKKKIRSYRDWFVYFYGRSLYEVMCRPYTSKVWRTDPSLISADWAEERFQGEKIIYLIKRVFTKLLTLDFSSYSIEDEEHIPDGGYFYYPEKGIQELPDALATTSTSHGADIRTGITIDHIERNSKTVFFKDTKTLQTETAQYTNLISTIPLNVFYDLQDQKNTAIAENIHNLVYMNIIFVFAFLNKNKISNDHWLYFPDNRILFNRGVEFSNWSPTMCPQGKTSVCFDITCYNDSDLWRSSDEEIANTVLNDADRIDYIKRADVESYHVYRLKYAYPFYDLGYKKKLDNVVRFFEKDNCHLLGRTGMFRYNNADNSMEMGFALADNFLKNKENPSIYDYQIKHISL